MRISFSAFVGLLPWVVTGGSLFGQGTLIFPQFVNGESGGVANRSRIILRNNCGVADMGVLRFRDADGDLTPVPLGSSTAAEISFAVPPWGVFDEVTGGTGPLLSGSVEVQSQRGADTCLEGTIAYDILGSQVSADSAPLAAHHQVYASRTQNEAAGVAIFNPNPDKTVQIEALLVDQGGEVRAQRTLQLGARHQTAQFVDQESMFGDYFANNPGDFRGTVNLNTLFGGEGFPDVAVLGLIQNSVTSRLTAVAASRQALTRFRISNLTTPRTNLRLSASQLVFDIPVRVEFEDPTATAPSEDLTVAFQVGNPFFGTIPDPLDPGIESGVRVIQHLSTATPAETGTLEFFLHRVVAPELLQTGVVRPLAVPITLSMSNAMNQPSNILSSYVLVDAGGVVEGLDGAAGVAISPDGRHVYAAAANDDAVVLFERDPENGTLRFVQALFNTDPMIDGLQGVNFAAVSPDGRHLYTLSSSTHSLATFGRNADTGELTFLGFLRDGQGEVDFIREPRSLAISPDGAYVYVASARDDALTVFERDSATGMLQVATEYIDNAGGVDGLDGARATAVSPDGMNVYVASSTDDALASFRRLPDGSLAFQEAFFDGMGDFVDGLDGASGLAVSPDGLRVYATSELDNGVAVFARDPNNGELSFLTALFDGVGGIDGLDGASAVVVSPDNRHVYVASNDDNAVAAFERSPSSGTLRFIGALRDGVGGVDGLRQALSITISPDGLHLYVAAEGDDGVGVFERDPETGFLHFVEARLESQSLLIGESPGRKQ